MLTPEEEMVKCQKCRHPRRGIAVAALPVQQVPSFARVEGSCGIVEPPRRHAQPFERLWCLHIAQCRCEACACLTPRATCQRRVTDAQWVAERLPDNIHVRAYNLRAEMAKGSASQCHYT